MGLLPSPSPPLPFPPLTPAPRSPQLEQFKADNMNVGFGSGTRALEQALERTKANIKWVQENKQPVLAWFKSEAS